MHHTFSFSLRIPASPLECTVLSITVTSRDRLSATVSLFAFSCSICAFLHHPLVASAQTGWCTPQRISSLCHHSRTLLLLSKGSLIWSPNSLPCSACLQAKEFPIILRLFSSYFSFILKIFRYYLLQCSVLMFIQMCNILLVLLLAFNSSFGIIFSLLQLGVEPRVCPDPR